MMVYQVLDENNNKVGEYSNLDYALENAHNLTIWHGNHIYHVQEIQLTEFLAQQPI